MTIDERLDAIRQAIQIDIGDRGLARDPGDNLFTACRDDLANACQSIAQHPAPRVGIITGFMIPSVEPPTGETDGPPGAIFLARALTRIGIPCVFLADASCVDALWAGLPLLGCSPGLLLIDLPTNPDFAAALRQTQPLSHLIAIERSGPSYDFATIPQADRGRNHTMRGRDITELTFPAHQLFEGPRDYVTIGIGDGGNEIGMGKVPYPTVCRNIPNGDKVACRVATDHLIVAGVSNWGAWALAAGVMMMKGAVDATLFDPQKELMLLEHLVKHGPLVDGVTGQRTATVDGLSFAEYVMPLEQIGRLVRA
jgi:D-glutamate cyclase